jgi:hypothetical protein
MTSFQQLLIVGAALLVVGVVSWPGGLHLVVKTEMETLEVHLGPTGYLSEQKVVIASGDAVEILGSWTLRDASGRPMWSGRRR